MILREAAVRAWAWFNGILHLRPGDSGKREAGEQMREKFGSYFESIRAHLKVDPAAKRTLITELQGHCEDNYEDLKRQGLPEDKARERAVRLLGSPRVVAQQLVDLYSQGTWKQAACAAMPHLIVSWLLAVRAWYDLTLVSGVLIGMTLLGATITVVYGWCMGKPTWLFPWLGYYLLPVIGIGILVVTLPIQWNWLIAVAYIPLAAAALFYIMRQTLREDWLLASLMILPMPVVVFWGVTLGVGTEPEGVSWRVFEAAPRISLSFLALAVTSATFVRMKQRRVKIAALVAPMLGILAVIGASGESALGFFGWLVLTVGCVALLLSPALLEHTQHRS